MRLIKRNTIIDKFILVLVLLLGVYVVFGATSNVDPNVGYYDPYGNNVDPNIGYYEDPYGNNVDYYNPYGNNVDPNIDYYDSYSNNTEENISSLPTDNNVRSGTPITEEEIENFCSTLDEKMCIEDKLCEPEYHENFGKCVSGQQLIREAEMRNFCSTLDEEECIEDRQCEPGYKRTWETLFLFESFYNCVSLNTFEFEQQSITEEEVERFCNAYGLEECIKDRLCEPEYYKSFDKCVKGQQSITEEEMDKREVEKERMDREEMEKEKIGKEGMNNELIKKKEMDNELITSLSKIVNQSPEDEFGYSVATTVIKIIVVGAPGDDEIASNAGAVYVFKTINDGTYTLIKKVTPDIGNFTIEETGFGEEVFFSEEYLSMNSRSGAYTRSTPIEWFINPSKWFIEE